MLEKILVPDLGDYSEVEIIGIAVKVGQTIKADDELITLETDKATMEIPAPKAGVIKELLVKLGDKVSKGSDLLILDLDANAVNAPELNDKKDQQEVPKVLQQSPVNHKAEHRSGQNIGSSIPYAGPGVRRFARELGVDLTKVIGTGRKARIMSGDIKSFVQQSLSNVNKGQANTGLNISAAPEIDFKQFGSVEKQPLGRIQKISGAFLHRNWVTIPHVTQFDEADITELEFFRKNQKALAEAQGVKLTPLVFLMKAVVVALKQFPKFNASLATNGEELILKKYFNVGVAVDTPNGLVVPVIKDVDKKGIFELAADLAVISKKARDGKLTGADMQAGCFTISSLGGIGGTAFTPIINAPELAILGVSKSQMKPVYNEKLDADNKFEARLMLPLSLSYDHRVIDGADAVRFTSFLVSLLADIRRILL